MIRIRPSDMSAALSRQGPVETGTRQFHLTEARPPENGTMLGFWLFLISDLLLFACLFGVYAVLGRNYATGFSGADIFDLKLVALSTALLLCASFSGGHGVVAMQDSEKHATLGWLALTGLFGLTFLGIEIHAFSHMIGMGATPQRSAFLSAFFALVGIHGLHVAFGLIWLITLLVQVGQHGLIPANRRRIRCLTLFWHFLDVVWIAVFSLVYLIGSLS